MFKLLSNVRKIIYVRQASVKISAEGKDIPKKKVYENRITLIGPDDSITITDLNNAQNLSTRRALKLVKVQDTDSKTRRPIYKLMTTSQYHEEELQRRKEKQMTNDNVIKGDKLITVSTKIAENDLMTKIKKIEKLIDKHYEVRVVINSDDADGESKSEKIYTIMENNLKSSGRLVQKRSKGNTLKFQVLTLKDKGTGAKSNSDSSKDNGDKGAL